MAQLAPFLPPENDPNDPNNALHLRRFTAEYDAEFAFDDGMRTPMAAGLGVPTGANGYVGAPGPSLDYFATALNLGGQNVSTSSMLQHVTGLPVYWPTVNGYTAGSRNPLPMDGSRRTSIDPLQTIAMPNLTMSSGNSSSASLFTGSSSTEEHVITPELRGSESQPQIAHSKDLLHRRLSSTYTDQSRQPPSALNPASLSSAHFTNFRTVGSQDSFHTVFSSPSSLAASPDTAVSSSYASSPPPTEDSHGRVTKSTKSRQNSRSVSDAEVAPLTNAAAARIENVHTENSHLRALAGKMSINMPPRKRSKHDDEEDEDVAPAHKTKRSSKGGSERHPVQEFSIRYENGVLIDETPDPGQPEAKYFTPTEDQLASMDARKRKQWKNCLNSRKNRKGQKEELTELREYRDLTETIVPTLQAQLAKLQADLESERIKSNQLAAEKNHLQVFVQALQGLPAGQ